MIYDVLIRHTHPIARGDGFEHSMELRHIDADTEEEAYSAVHHGADDFIACIDAWHHRGIAPYSVDSRAHPEFFSDAQRPQLTRTGSEPRVG